MNVPEPPPIPPSQPPAPQGPPPYDGARAQRIGARTSILILLIYMGFFRWAFAQGWAHFAGGVVSLSFIWSVPFAVGGLSVAIGRWLGSDDYMKYAINGPVLTMLLGMAVSLVTRIEASICIIMALPIFWGAAILGGAFAHWLLPRNRPTRKLHLSIIVCLPVIAAQVEGQLVWPTEIKAIENTITIHAPAEVIWKQIASVPAIPREQIADRWIYRVGFPKPIAATLDHEGVGGTRTATFERNVSFFEKVTVWEFPRKLSFTIHADPDFIPHTAFDRHIIVGGRFYDVLDGTYEIEPLTPGTCRLHLTSNHRLSTRFNSYAGWWSEKIMDQIQGSILEVIRSRAEEGAAQKAER